MGFDRKLLNTDEEILLDLRPHWWFVTPQVALLIATIVVTGIVARVFDLPALGLWILAGIVVVAALNLAWRWFNWSGVNFVITTDRLISRSGVIAKKGIEIPLERINNVHFAQTLFERLVGSGDLTVESAGEGGQQHFDNVRRPKLVQQEIYRAMEINKDQEFTAMAQANAAAQTGHPGYVAPAASIPEQIEQLDRLRLQGVITEAEFQAKKSELLDRM